MTKEEILQDVRILENCFDYAQILTVYIKHIVENYDESKLDDLAFDIQEIVQQFAIPRYKIDTLKKRISELSSDAKKVSEIDGNKFDEISIRIKSILNV